MLMSGMPNKVFDEALSLPVEERVHLIEHLLHSLNLPIQSDIDDAWKEEAERRVAQLEGGAVEAVPADDVFRAIRERYQQ